MRRAAWTCRDCGVTSRRLDGEPVEQPRGWRDGRCVVCFGRHLRDTGQKEELARYELRRGRSIHEVSSATGLKKPQVKSIRDDMGDLSPATKPKPEPKPPKRKRATGAADRAEAALKRDHARPNPVIAEEVGTSPGVVLTARKKLGLPKAPAKKRKPRVNRLADRVDAALRGDPAEGNRKIAEDLGASVSYVRARRQKLGIPPPKVDGHGRRLAPPPPAEPQPTAG